jgi:hypothetical protein
MIFRSGFEPPTAVRRRRPYVGRLRTSKLSVTANERHEPSRCCGGVVVGALLEEGRSELFWLPDLSVVDEDIAV